MKGVVNMTAYELLEILKDHYKDDKTLIEETNDLLEQIYKDDKFVYKVIKGTSTLLVITNEHTSLNIPYMCSFISNDIVRRSFLSISLYSSLRKRDAISDTSLLYLPIQYLYAN